MDLMKSERMRRRKEENIRFQISFTETNLFWALGITPLDQEKIDRINGQLKSAKANLREVSTTNERYQPWK
jgi:hypothetical protein